jgi:endonuclease/exonuclease/phosphatase (EEP) superfamily protein YafD
MHLLADAVLALSIVAAVAGVASVLGRASEALDVAAHFAPVWLAAGTITAGLGWLAGSDLAPASIGLGAVGAAAAAAVMAPEVIARMRRRHAPARAGATLKVVQLNLWRWNRDVAGTVDWLAREAADIVVVQEVVDDAVGVPAALSGAYPHHQGDEATRTWILSKAPSVASGALRARSTRRHSTGAWARFQHPQGDFSVLGFQATWPIPPGSQQRDSADVARWLKAFDQASLIVCGDFNSTPWSAALARQDRLFGLERRSRALFTWPVQPYTRLQLRSPFPILALDHVYAGAAWKTVDVRAGPRLGSDHLPVVVVLTR